MEKQQRGASNEAEEKKISEEIQALKQDLEYVRVSYLTFNVFCYCVQFLCSRLAGPES